MRRALLLSLGWLVLFALQPVAASRSSLFVGNSFLFGSGSAVRLYRAETDPRSLGDGECSAYELGMSRAETRSLQQIAFDQLGGTAATPPAPATTQKPAPPRRCVTGR